MAVKHSKYRNTGILFELLVRQTTADLLENKDSKAVKILKKYFTNTDLGKDHTIFSKKEGIVSFANKRKINYDGTKTMKKIVHVD